MNFTDMLTRFPQVNDTELAEIKGGDDLPPVTVIGFPRDGGASGGGYSGNPGDSSHILPPSVSPGDTAPYQPTYVNPQIYFQQHFGSFSSSHGALVMDGTPEGYTLNAQGRFVKNGVIADGVTQMIGGFIFVNIDPYALDTTWSDVTRQEIIGHELIHAKQIDEHYDMYVNNNAQFQINSDYAAYSYQLNVAKYYQDQASINMITQELNKLQPKVTEIWTSSYADIPIKVNPND